MSDQHAERLRIGRSDPDDAPLKGPDSPKASQERAVRPRRRGWPWLRALVLLGLGGIIAAQLQLARGCRSEWSATRSVFENALSPLSTAQIDLTVRFLSSAPELSPGNTLEVARLRTTERIERSSTARFLGLRSSSRVELEVPVDYRYGVPWDRDWKIDLWQAPSDSLGFALQVCRVDAPALVPLLPPGIDTEGLRILRAKDWKLQRFDRTAVDSVLADLSPELTRRARSDAYLGLVREMARQQVEAFVRLWILRQPERDVQAIMHVEVRFADDSAPSVAKDTLELPAR